MTVREWCEMTGAKITNPTDEVLNSEMTDDLLRQIDDEIDKAIKNMKPYSLPESRRFTLEKFDELFDKIANERPTNDFVYYAYSKESAEKMKELDPGCKVVVLPQKCKLCDYDKGKIFVIPCDNDKPVKVVFDGE